MNEKLAAKWVWGNIDQVTRSATFGRKYKRQDKGWGGLLLTVLIIAAAAALLSF